ncbi:hypothetical protein C8J56DRAFT_1049476 [Mycena floridula]|nr:hypothetical protein C8J56DRAFT_1049476 [Mycena floridula]
MAVGTTLLDPQSRLQRFSWPTIFELFRIVQDHPISRLTMFSKAGFRPQNLLGVVCAFEEAGYFLRLGRPGSIHASSFVAPLKEKRPDCISLDAIPTDSPRPTITEHVLQYSPSAFRLQKGPHPP